jgi:hypothetical protein
MISLISLIQLLVQSSAQTAGFAGNTGNCVGTKSCRPRCISFQFDRKVTSYSQCLAKTGSFAVNGSYFRAWDLNHSGVTGCMDCKLDGVCHAGVWGGDLNIRVTEANTYWTVGSQIGLAGHLDKFTYCSLNPCPRTEFEMAEQLVRTRLDGGRVIRNTLCER